MSLGFLVTTSTLWAAETKLGSFGQTQLQQSTGDSVQRTCGGFVGAQTAPGTIALFDTCRAMVHTANDLEGSGGSRDSLGLTAEELASGLQHIATEEFAASGQLATEVGLNRMNIGINRLTELRRGARGFSVAGLNPYNAAMQAENYPGLGTSSGERGGGAGDSDIENKLGIFVTGSYSTGDRDHTKRTDGFDFDTYGATFGMDYRFTENLILGAAVTYNDVDSDFDKNSTVAGGGVDADGWGGFVYGTYYSENFYIDGLAGYAKSDYDVERKIFIANNNATVYGGNDIRATAKGDTDSDDYTASLGGGYYFGGDALTYGPYARLSYLKVEVDGYKESGADSFGLNLDVDGQDWESLTGVLGVQMSYASSRDFGVIMPQGRIGWVHEFEDDSQNMAATYVDDPRNNKLFAITDEPDADYFEVSVGVSAVFKNGLQAFANYETVLGLDELTIHLFSLGGRWEF